MTQPSPESPSPPVVNPEPESRLDQLAARYAVMKPQLDELTAQVKAVTDGIKAELTTAHPGSTEVLLTSPHLAQPLQLQAVTSWRIDSPGLKKADPQTYVRWAKKSTSWRLAPLAG